MLGRQGDAASTRVASVWVLFALSAGKSVGVAMGRREGGNPKSCPFASDCMVSPGGHLPSCVLARGS